MTVSSSEKRNILIITALISVAVACRALAISGIISYVSTNDVSSYYLSLLRTLIYAGLFMFWGISIHKRILQRQTRRLLLAVVVLMVFWLTVRTVKYLFVPTGVILSNWLWYSYYIPMLLIPLLLCFTAVSLGWPEEKRLPRKAYLLYLPAAVLILLVLSNDLHELVFDFPEDGLQMYLFNNYRYGPVFYGCLAWEGVLYLAAFLITVLTEQ